MSNWRRRRPGFGIIGRREGVPTATGIRLARSRLLGANLPCRQATARAPGVAKAVHRNGAFRSATCSTRMTLRDATYFPSPMRGHDVGQALLNVARIA